MKLGDGHAGGGRLRKGDLKNEQSFRGDGGQWCFLVVNGGTSRLSWLRSSSNR